MKDVFIEQLVKKKYTEADRRKKLFTIAVAVAATVFIVNSIGYIALSKGSIQYLFITVLLIGITIFVAYKKIAGLNVEFEYVYTDGILDIDMIKNRSKRKTVFSGNVSEFEVMAHFDDRAHLAMYENLPLQYFNSCEVLGNTYVFVTTGQGSKKRFVIDPKKELLDAMLVDMTPSRCFRVKQKNFVDETEY